MKNYLTLMIGTLLIWNSVTAQSAFPGERGEYLGTSTREDIWDHEPKGFLVEFVRVQRDAVIASAGYLPEMVFENPDPVVQVIDESNKEVLFTVRIKGKSFLPKVYSDGKYTVKAGKDRPDSFTKKGLEPTAKKLKVNL